MAIKSPEEAQNLAYQQDSFDTVETYNKSKIQHGPYNDRVYLMKLSRDDFPAIIDYLDTLATAHGYSKLFIKIPAWATKEFLRKGYHTEAIIPRFYRGNIDGYFLACYRTKTRKHVSAPLQQQMKKVLHAALNNRGQSRKISSESADSVTLLEETHADQLASLYRTVFQTYPFPIFNPDYIKQKMKKDTRFYGVFHGDDLIAASSSELDYDSSNVEFTDFATLPAHRGDNISYVLLRRMESDMKQMKMITGYTIARSLSYGMNITFCRGAYHYAGTLVNNTCISGDIQSMNVYHKRLIDGIN